MSREKCQLLKSMIIIPPGHLIGLCYCDSCGTHKYIHTITSAVILEGSDPAYLCDECLHDYHVIADDYHISVDVGVIHVYYCNQYPRLTKL